MSHVINLFEKCVCEVLSVRKFLLTQLIIELIRVIIELIISLSIFRSVYRVHKMSDVTPTGGKPDGMPLSFYANKMVEEYTKKHRKCKHIIVAQGMLAPNITVVLQMSDGEDYTFECNTIVLAQASSVLHRLLHATEGTVRYACCGVALTYHPESNRLDVQGFDGEALCYMLHHMHGTMSPRNRFLYWEFVYDVIKVVYFFEYKALIRKCADFYLEQMTEHNCAELLLKPLLREEPFGKVVQAAFKMCLWHFKSIAASDEFLKFPSTLLSAILSHQYLNVDSEEQVRAALELWILAGDNSVHANFSALCSEALRKTAGHDWLHDVLAKVGVHRHVGSNKSVSASSPSSVEIIPPNASIHPSNRWSFRS